MNCSCCGMVFDGFTNKMYRNSHCKPCYNKRWYEGYFTRSTPINCEDCNVVLTSANVSSAHGSRCKKCYNTWLKGKRLNEHLCIGCNKPNPTKGKYCKLCKKAAGGRFLLNIPPTKVSQGKVIIPDDIKVEVIKLLIRHKNNLFNSVDHYIAAHLYLTLFVWDVELDSYPVESQVAYMVSVLKNLILQS